MGAAANPCLRTEPLACLDRCEVQSQPLQPCTGQLHTPALRPCLRSMRSNIAERALRWLGHVARMPSDKLLRRMLAAWVYQAKDSSARKRVAKQTTYGGTVARYHFKYVLMNPSVHPDVREALTREVEHRSIKTGLMTSRSS